MASDVASSQVSEIAPRVSEFRRFRRVLLGRGLVVFGLIVILVFIVLAIFAPVISPYKPDSQQLDQVLKGPSAQHLLGTDYLGRDTLSRLIYGARSSALVALVALGIATIIGMGAGLVAAYFGGFVNTVIMRIVDALMAFPLILLALIISALLGGGIRNVMIALGVALLPGYARLMCSVVLSVKETDYILAGRSLGSSDWRLMIRHIVPNSLPPLIVLITMQVGVTILAEAGLSYLGIGITPPTPSWGAMVNDGNKYILSNPLISFVPGLAIMVVVFAFNMVGDGLRDALDPRLRGTL
jgi:peptide/nickel transport system permease protein